MPYSLQRLSDSGLTYSGLVRLYTTFVSDDQLKAPGLWAKFIEAYRTCEDTQDLDWRGEYYGKMMRGACLMYQYTRDGRLYEVLSCAVRDVLSTQDENGRISTYTVEGEFSGWDIWCRKYILVGTLCFYRICKDNAFKRTILDSLMRHADYIISKIGDGKLPILNTSNWYGGLNSSSILEPFVDLYSLTGQARYLEFARYIMDQGGCLGGNLLELADKDEIYPYQYPEVKAYEMMSFFEGALAYYEVTGVEHYLETVEKFTRRVADSDITVIGCAGCKHEKFDNAKVTQALDVPEGTLMQETCVTVTWMRLLERLLRVTGKPCYAELFNCSALNAMFSSVNIHKERQYSREEKQLLEGLTFDSYSPLTYQRRGMGIGGFRKFRDPSIIQYYGCCACIGAAGIALIPLESIMESASGSLVLSSYFTGELEYKSCHISIEDNLYKTGDVTIAVHNPKPAELELDLLVPSWANGPKVIVNKTESAAQKGYHRVRLSGTENEIVLKLNPGLRAEISNNKISYSYGDLALARDQAKEDSDIREAFTKSYDYEILEPWENEMLRLCLKTKEGRILLTDYQSCGKRWNSDKAMISAWLNFRQD